MRLVRFDVSCPASLPPTSYPPPARLLPPAPPDLNWFPPDLNHKESPKIYLMECQKECQIECQNLNRPYTLPDGMSETMSEQWDHSKKVIVFVRMVDVGKHLSDSGRYSKIQTYGLNMAKRSDLGILIICPARLFANLGVSENRLNPIVPNGFADHYPVMKNGYKSLGIFTQHFQLPTHLW